MLHTLFLWPLCLHAGLTSAMYIKDGQQVPCPDPSAGLYICDRSGEVVQAAIQPGHIAYQVRAVRSMYSGEQCTVCWSRVVLSSAWCLQLFSRSMYAEHC